MVKQIFHNFIYSAIGYKCQNYLYRVKYHITSKRSTDRRNKWMSVQMTRGMSVMWLRSYTLSAREEIVWVPLVFDSQETLVITSPEFLLPMYHVLACLIRVLAVTEGAELFAHYGPSFRKTTIIQGTRIPAYGCWKRHQCCPESRMDGCIVSSNLHHFTLKKTHQNTTTTQSTILQNKLLYIQGHRIISPLI